MLNVLPPTAAPGSQAPSLRPHGAALAAPRQTLLDPTPSDSARLQLERVVTQAARERFPDRDVAVESFYDQASGRYVHRIADNESGEVLLQTPPDELLRFFASGREALNEPLVRFEV